MDKKIHSVMMLTLLLLGMLTLAFDTTPVRASIMVSDDFNDSTINSDLWDEGQLGGPTVD